MSAEKEINRPYVDFLPTVEENLCNTRATLGCNSENRRHICEINTSSFNNYLYLCQIPQFGRCLEQSPLNQWNSNVGDIWKNTLKYLSKHQVTPLMLTKSGCTFCGKSRA